MAEEGKLQIPPAVDKHVSVPPQLVEAVQEDPELLVKLTRSQMAVVQDRMVRRVLEDADVSLSALAAVHERLSKGARIEAKEQAQGAGGAQVVINFHRHSGRDTVTIEGSSTEVKDAA